LSGASFSAISFTVDLICLSAEGLHEMFLCVQFQKSFYDSAHARGRKILELPAIRWDIGAQIFKTKHGDSFTDSEIYCRILFMLRLFWTVINRHFCPAS